MKKKKLRQLNTAIRERWWSKVLYYKEKEADPLVTSLLGLDQTTPHRTELESDVALDRSAENDGE